jgi:farnesyl-diphosphate farnesyltransferase
MRFMQAEDWDFCKQALRRHSRTFAIPIGMLGPSLEPAITCAYLLCRIADTIEDTPEWDFLTKRDLYRTLEDALQDGQHADAFTGRVQAAAGGDPGERELLLNLPRVLRVFVELPDNLRETCRAFVAELIGGMMIYSQRKPGPDAVRCLSSEADLDRYCYFVAGVIGRLLTEAFVSQLPGISPERAATLRANAERFGAGLQLVNILRDMSTDLQRGECFIPRTLLDAAGVAPSQLCDTAVEREVRAMLQQLFDKARSHLDAAFEYTLAIPESATSIRRFCLVPLWLAVATLELCRTDAALLRTGERVKLSRDRVMQLSTECIRASSSDARLRESFATLESTSPVEAA